MHIVTGGAGFIGSVMVWELNRRGVDDVWIVDDLGQGEKWRNVSGLRFTELIGRGDFLDRMETDGGLPDGVDSLIHLGACSSTTERDADYLFRNNFEFTRLLAESAIARGVRMITASSGATYGAGECGYSDAEDNIERLRPLNMYGYSKQLFDRWAHKNGHLSRLVSLKFFNVYGPNEYHKGDMASMAFKAYRQIRETGRMRLFRSHRRDFGDGEQKRDFVYVKDVTDVMWWLLEHPEVNGLFNVGSGVAETWNGFATSVFAAIGMEPSIEYIDMPANLREQYQYLTEADIAKLRAAGYGNDFRSLRSGIGEYVSGYLSKCNPYIANGQE